MREIWRPEVVDPSQIAAAQGEMLANRLRKNARHLGKWARREGITCYRIYDRDIPEVPLAIDRFEGWLHVAEFARGEGEDRADDDRRAWLETLVDASARALEVSRDRIFVKRRERQRGARQYHRIARTGDERVVNEGGHRFLVNLSDFVDTGLFLDHRITRAMVERESRDQAVLNLFGYTGAFSIYAAAGGARSTTTVDLSRTYLDWARRNFELNGMLDPERRHVLVQAEAKEFLNDQIKRGGRYDLVVVDPPTFSNSKRFEGYFDVQHHHGELLARVLDVLAPGGVVYFSTNRRRFKLDLESLPSVDVEDITARTVPPDFRDRRVHQCFKLRRQRRVIGMGGEGEP
jgi:23S rRNA G2069 N7-methylase RlmK/C1962 C5-methylase RlmI